MDEKIIESIKKYIEESGLPLEIEASSKLKEYDWKIRNQAYFFDEEIMKPRTIDIHASKLFLLENKAVFDRLIIGLIIECKTSERPWIFYTEEYVREKDHLIGIMSWLKNIIDPSNEQTFKKHMLSLGNYSHYFWHKNERISVIGDVLHKGKDMLYEASCQVTKALNYYKLFLIELVKKANLKPYGIFYPIIIFSGRMFEIKYEYGEFNVEEIKYISYNFSGVAKEPESFLIEIVHQDFLYDYMKVLDKEHSITLERLEKIF